MHQFGSFMMTPSSESFCCTNQIKIHPSAGKSHWLETNATFQGTTKGLLFFDTQCYNDPISFLNNHYDHAIHQIGKTTNTDISPEDTWRTKAIRKMFCLYHRSNPMSWTGRKGIAHTPTIATSWHHSWCGTCCVRWYFYKIQQRSWTRISRANIPQLLTGIRLLDHPRVLCPHSKSLWTIQESTCTSLIHQQNGQ